MLNDNNKIHQTHLLPPKLTLTLLRRPTSIPCLVVLFIVSCANFISPRDPLAGIKHLAALFFNSQVAPNKRHLVRLLKIHSHATYRFRLISDASGTWFFSVSLLRAVSSRVEIRVGTESTADFEKLLIYGRLCKARLLVFIHKIEAVRGTDFERRELAYL